MQSSALARPERIGWLIALLSFSAPAFAQQNEIVGESAGEDPFVDAPSASERAAAWKPPSPQLTPRPVRGYRHWLGGAYLGRGLRFNNPYRLRSELGDGAQSLSLTATYLDLQAVRLFSDP